MYRSSTPRSRNGVRSLLRRNWRRTGAHSTIVIDGNPDGARRGRASSSDPDLRKRGRRGRTTWATRSHLRAW